MSKEKQKALETLLVNAMNQVLNNELAGASKELKKTTLKAAKSISKKFYKTLKVNKGKAKAANNPIKKAVTTSAKSKKKKQ